jgi:hypothetical protein
MTRVLYRITFEYRGEETRSFIFEDTPETVEATVEALKASHFESSGYRYIEHAPLVLGDVIMELITF